MVNIRKPSQGWFVAVVLLVVFSGVVPLRAEGVLVVNDAGDAPDVTPGDGICATVGQVCTLRAAIEEANALPGTDTIDFNLATPYTITPALGLPVISTPMLIDGTSQPGYNGTPLVVLNGGALPQFPPGLPTNGLYITGGGTTVKGLVIQGFSFAGIMLQGSGGNRIQSSYIGTDAPGTAKNGNRDGIYILDSPNNTIGGTQKGDGNLISGNHDDGINFNGKNASGSVVQGNLIGLTANGKQRLGNADAGIKVDNAPGNIIGGTTPGAGNVISANGSEGVYLVGNDTTGTVIQGNTIGADPLGSFTFGNRGVAILIENASGTMISSNRIWSNGGGVAVPGGVNNAILGNALSDNRGLGIDLGASGIDANDPGDGDTGANNQQNYPRLTSAALHGGNLTLSGTLNSTPNTPFQIEIFDNGACDSSGNGEGQALIGSVHVTTDGSGNVGFSATFSNDSANYLTATATDPLGNTSEFSPCQGIGAG